MAKGGSSSTKSVTCSRAHGFSMVRGAGSKGEFFGDKVVFYCAFSGAAAGGDMAANNPSLSPLIPSVK